MSWHCRNVYDAHDSLHNQRVSSHWHGKRLDRLIKVNVETSSQGQLSRLKHQTRSAKITLAVKSASSTCLRNELGPLNGSNAAVQAETSRVGPPELGFHSPTSYSNTPGRQYTGPENPTPYQLRMTSVLGLLRGWRQPTISPRMPTRYRNQIYFVGIVEGGHLGPWQRKGPPW